MIKQSNEQIKKVSKEGIIANNMIFYLCDFLEVFTHIAEHEFIQCGLRLDNRTKMLLNTIKYVSKDMRARTRETGLESQMNFGEEADILKEIMLLCIDRTGDTNVIAEHFVKYVKSFPSLHKLNLKKFGI